MERTISVLGSTGSVGRQSLEVIEHLGYGVSALCAGVNTEIMETQVRRFSPKLAVMYNEKSAKDLRVKLADTSTKVLSGMEGLVEAASTEEADTVLTAVVGTVGLIPTVSAIRRGKRIALANKETLVCAGDIVMSEAEKFGAEIVPVDSEHSAIFQCMEGRKKEDVKHIILTASGGPFRGKKLDELQKVTKEQALRHPNWHMGPKITVDCATLMNKGLEFIEAMHLFGVGPERIKIIIHPQSIIHSMVEFRDNSIMAQLAVPDMRLPIQYALTYPQCRASLTGEMDFTKLAALTFEEPDVETFKCLALAMETAKKPGTACAVMNAANEEAVGLFLKDKISFSGIYESVALAVEKIGDMKAGTIEDILAADEEARRLIIGKA
ncbi:MAG: 1-deoxy-D-xylulose-5-phosphate reductoisomerase [Oscillospiraceae bacterium]